MVDKASTETDVVDAELGGDASPPVADGGVDFGLAVDGARIEEQSDAPEENVEVTAFPRKQGARARAEIGEALREGG